MKPYYEHNGITIFHGDSREIIPMLPKVDCVITDPPYGVNLGSHVASKKRRVGYLVKKAYESYEDTEENLRCIVVPIITDAIALAGRGAIFCAGTMMWHFPRPAAVGGVYLPAACGRNCWGFSSLAHLLLYGKAPDLNLGSKHIAITSSESAENNGHPCPKPLGWMNWVVGLASRQNETILDPFMGSGTTLVAAKQLGRKAIGIEISEKYCSIAAKRLSQEYLFSPVHEPTPKIEQPALFGQ